MDALTGSDAAAVQLLPGPHLPARPDQLGTGQLWPSHLPTAASGNEKTTLPAPTPMRQAPPGRAAQGLAWPLRLGPRSWAASHHLEPVVTATPRRRPVGCWGPPGSARAGRWRLLSR